MPTRRDHRQGRAQLVRRIVATLLASDHREQIAPLHHHHAVILSSVNTRNSTTRARPTEHRSRIAAIYVPATAAPRHVRIAGTREHLVRAHHLAVAQPDDPLRARRDVGIVRHDEHGDPGLMDLGQQIHDLLRFSLSSAPVGSSARIKPACRSTRGAIATRWLLAPNLGGWCDRPVAQPDGSKYCGRDRWLAARDALIVERQRDVLERGLERQQIEDWNTKPMKRLR